MRHANVISWHNVDYGGAADHNPDDATYTHRILAEGDSWFTFAGMPTSNLLFRMAFSGSTIIVSCAAPGDTIRHMAELAANRALRDAMSAGRGSAWDAILLSGGGNDLIDAAGSIIRRSNNTIYPHPRDYCNPTVLQDTLDDIERGYRAIVALRDRSGSACRGKPVIAHTYDRITPRDAAARVFGFPVSGPWLFKALSMRRVPVAKWQALSDYLIGRLRSLLLELESGPARLPDFHVVDTRDTLVPAAPGERFRSFDWVNEIHPTAGGYQKLAARISARVRRLLPM